MRNYLALIVFGLMLAEALSSRPPIDFEGPDFDDEPGFKLDELTSDDINGEEPLLETRGHTLGHNQGEPDFEEEPEEEVERRPPPDNEELGVEPEEEAEAGDFEPESVADERTLPGEEERDLEQKYLMLMPEDLEGIFISLLDNNSLKNNGNVLIRMLIPLIIYSYRAQRHKCQSKESNIRRR